jgi:ferrous iron transport protein B
MSAEAARRSRPARVVLAGNPNSGKSTLFNALSGSNVRVGNYPGVTVDRRSARATLAGAEVELIDLPGTYALTAGSPEEQVAVDLLLNPRVEAPDAIIAVLDATTLGRGLYLTLCLLETGVPVVVGLNMMDEARASGLDIDVSRLSEALGATVVPIAAAHGEGLDALREALAETLVAPPPLAALRPARASAAEVDEVFAVAARLFPERPASVVRAYATWALLSLGGDELVGVPPEVREVVEAASARALGEGRDLDRELIADRYARVDALVAAAVRTPEDPALSVTERMDRVLTHPVAGLAVFAFVMFLVFEALFTWSEPFVGLIEGAVGALSGWVSATLPAGPFTDLLVSGVIAGVGNVVVFVPQIALLFVFITFLEDSGYLARVAFVIDRLMSSVGLHGKAFVPLLSGFACAIPAVMATRTIDNRRDRLITMLALPLMSCSARLPIYVLIIATLFAGEPRVFGVLSVGALVLFAMYALSVVATLGAAAAMRRTVLRGPRPTLVLELPPYRWPTRRGVTRAVVTRVRSFLVDAGTIILALTIVLWALLNYPKDGAVVSAHEAERVEARAALEGDALRDQLATIDDAEHAGLLAHSAAGRLGHLVEPLIEPLGFDWRLGVGIVGAFAAREVFVSTLGIVFGVGESDEESVPLREALTQAKRSDGSPLFTPLVGVSLMVFFVLACQCMSTIAVVRRESGSWRYPLFMFAYMTALAYGASLLVFQVGRAMGFT